MNQLNILFICGLYSQDRLLEYRKHSKGGLQFAAQNLQESIIEGAIANGASVQVITKPILSTFPLGYNCIKVDSCDYIYDGKIIGKSLGYINIPFFNKPSLNDYISIIKKWYSNNSGRKTIWVYSLNKDFMRVATIAKQLYSDIITVQIVPDLPRFMGCNKYYRRFGFQKKDINEIYKLVMTFDRYVLLCNNMAGDLGIENKSYTVMEGIFSPEKDDIPTDKDNHKTILYTGNIDERYGIVDLIKAFSYIKDSDYRLWIRGDGATEDLIKKYIAIDNRISLIPQLSKLELLALERKASLLVNPVSYKQEFTSYFFPSKTMDYLASGTPTMMHNLSCLPNEYKDHLYFFTNDTPAQMVKDIISFFSKDAEERNCKGKLASLFIAKEKTSAKQVKKILDII